MNREELVSIIIPCYNIENYVERCIDSIIKQSYQNLEIIAVDDGSTDHTGKILDNLAKADHRIVVLHGSNGGLSAARNRGLDFMNGKFVICVDGDDFIDIDMVKSLHDTAVQYGSDIVACNYYMYYDENEICIGNKLDISKYDMDSEEAIEKLFAPQKRFVAAWAKLYKGHLFENVRYPEKIRFGEDMFTTHLLLDKSKRISYLSIPLYYYSQQGESLVRSDFNKHKLNMVRANREWLGMCNKKYPRLVECARNNLYSTMVNLCSYLCKEKKYYEDYEDYRKEIRESFVYIWKSDLSKEDKIKAGLISLMNPKIYYIIRKILCL